MSASAHSRLKLLLELMAIPSISASPREDEAAQFIHSRLSELDYFKKNKSHLALVSTKLERSPYPLHTVIARVMAAKKTSKTIILVAHYDVVEVSMYKDLAPLAFTPNKLQDALLANPSLLYPKALEDLRSGNFIFGRGSMDMKCGLALEMEIIKDFASNNSMFDVNILLLAVPDEENASAGMRGAVPALAKLQEEENLDYIAVINTEPSEPGKPNATGEVLFTGTVGKLMPVFLCVGQETHVGNYYAGFSAPLLAANIIRLAEANPHLADPAGELTCPSWICLGSKILRSSYSVTVPNRAAVYFNTFSIKKTPGTVLNEAINIAKAAALESNRQVMESAEKLISMGYVNGTAKNWDIPVVTIKELTSAALEKLGSEKSLSSAIEAAISASEEKDLRDLSLVALQEILLLSGKTGPMIIVGFLPPYYPARNNESADAPYIAMNKAVQNILQEARGQYGIEIEETPLFAGICDLSYTGFSGKAEELHAFEENLSDQGALYKLPGKDLAKLDIPIINLGPRGFDAHKLEERLELAYSLETLPKLLDFAIREIARQNNIS